MSKISLICLALLALLACASALKGPGFCTCNNNFGKDVKTCETAECYNLCQQQGGQRSCQTKSKNLLTQAHASTDAAAFTDVDADTLMTQARAAEQEAAAMRAATKIAAQRAANTLARAMSQRVASMGMVFDAANAAPAFYVCNCNGVNQPAFIKASCSQEQCAAAGPECKARFPAACTNADIEVACNQQL